MAKLSILAGATSQSVNIFIQNSSVTTGAGLTGLVFNSGSLIAYYAFNGANGGSNVISLVTLAANNSAYSSGGFKEIDATNMPGLYRFDIPNAALATSKGRSVTIMLSGAANMAPVLLEIELTAVDNQSTAFGLSLAKTTNITGFNDIAASAIVSSGAITTSGGAVSTVTTVTNQLSAAAIATGVWTDTTAGDFTTALSIGKSIMNGVSLGTGLTINSYTGNTPQTGDSFARIGATGSGLTSLAASSTALSTVQWTNTLATNLGTLAGHDPGTTLGTSTLTQTQVTGGAYSIQSASCILGDARIANLDAAVSTRGTSTLTQTQVTGGAYNIQSASCILGDTRIAHLDADVSSRLASSSISLSGGAVTVGTNNDKIGYSLSSAGNDAIVTDIFGTTMAESYPTKGAAFTLAQAAYDIVQHLNEMKIVSTTLTINKRDQVTAAKTFTLNDATNPSAITEVT